MTDPCEICACLNAQQLSAIEAGSLEQLYQARELMEYHEAEHRWREVQAERDEAEVLPEMAHLWSGRRR